MKNISAGIKSPRAGAAGNFMVPDSTSRSLSKITKNERVMTVRKNSVAMSLSYRNNKREVKDSNSVYSDLSMRRLSYRQKFKEAMRSTAYIGKY